jgi:hypothetical protein
MSTKIDSCLDVNRSKLINGDMLHNPNYQVDEDFILDYYYYYYYYYYYDYYYFYDYYDYYY